MRMIDTYSLMIHGGAGALDNVADERIAVRYLESIRVILEHGRAVSGGVCTSPMRPSVPVSLVGLAESIICVLFRRPCIAISADQGRPETRTAKPICASLRAIAPPAAFVDLPFRLSRS